MHTVTQKHIAACKSSRKHKKSLRFDPVTFFSLQPCIYLETINHSRLLKSLAYTANFTSISSGAEAPPSGEICYIHDWPAGNSKVWDFIFIKICLNTPRNKNGWWLLGFSPFLLCYVGYHVYRYIHLHCNVFLFPWCFSFVKWDKVCPIYTLF